MRAKLGILSAVTLAGGSLLAVATAVASPAANPAGGTARDAATAAAPRELIYVANANQGPVTVYPAGSRGAVAPVRTVMAPGDPNAFWDPWGVTFDSTGHLYVQTFLSDATTAVFAPGASGTVRPVRKFMGIGPDNRSIAVDAKGFEYVAGSDQPTVVVVMAPGAAGKPANLYEVPPVRTIQLDEQWNPWPSDLAVDTSNQLLAVTVRPRGNAVEVYAGGAHGSNTPVRVVSGADTGLGSCPPLCDLVIAFSPLTGRIYVGVNAGAATHISVFAVNAAGNADPLRTIEGPATGLAGKAITGLTVGRCGGTIYAMVHNSSTGFGAARIDAYGRLARGNAQPLRSFTDRRSGFSSAQGLTVTACASP